MPPTLSFQSIGTGLPILFIHGWEMRGLVESHDFEPIFTNLADPDLRRIYIDLPGMGDTPAHNVQNLDDIFDALVRFIDSTLGGGRFLLAGSSCGAYLARAVAQRYSDRVDGLLLRVPLMEPEDERRDLDVFEPVVRDQRVVDGLGAAEREMLGDIVVQTPAYVGALRARFEESFNPAVQAADGDVLGPIRADPQRYRLSFWEDVEGAKFFAPTLVVCGRHDDSVGYRDSRRLLELYPRSTYVVLDRGTHALPVDEGGVFEALVRDWIFRVKEWRGSRVDMRAVIG